MTDILNSFWGRKKPKPVTPERPATESAVDEYVIVNNTSSSSGVRQPTSIYPTTQPNNDYESLFSYLRVTDMQSSGEGGYQPMRPAPPVPPSATLPYPLRRSTVGPGNEMTSSASYTSFTAAAVSTTSTVTANTAVAAAAAAESSSAPHYLSGVPFQLAKELGGDELLNQLNRDMHIKSPNLSEYEYSFAVEMQVIQDLSPNGATPSI